MRKFITKFQDVGICEVNVFKVVKNWSNKFFISQWDDKYTLVKQGRGERHAKVHISKEQALEIIEKANLFPISGFFKSGKTYRSKHNILSEIDRLSKILDEKNIEIQNIKEIIQQYNFAISEE